MTRRSSTAAVSDKIRPEKSILDLFVLRHGEAGVKIDDPEKDDARPLTREGRQEMEVVARSLTGIGVRIDLVASSPLPRAFQTAEVVARRFKKLNRLEQWEELKPQSETDAFYRRLSRQKRSTGLLIVGHEPMLGWMIGEIISGSRGVNLVLKKAGLAKVEILGFRPKITGELRWLLTPRLLKKTA